MVVKSRLLQQLAFSVALFRQGDTREVKGVREGWLSAPRWPQAIGGGIDKRDTPSAATKC